jgi:hypothetical protein
MRADYGGNSYCRLWWEFLLPACSMRRLLLLRNCVPAVLNCLQQGSQATAKTQGHAKLCCGS